MKKCGIFIFFIIEQVFFKGVHRKDKNVQTVFASIPIPNFAFSKNKDENKDDYKNINEDKNKEDDRKEEVKEQKPKKKQRKQPVEYQMNTINLAFHFLTKT